LKHILVRAVSGGLRLRKPVTLFLIKEMYFSILNPNLNSYLLHQESIDFE